MCTVDYWMSVRNSDSIQVEEPGNEVIDLKVNLVYVMKKDVAKL